MNRPSPARSCTRTYLWPATLLAIIALALSTWYIWGHFYPRSPRLAQPPTDSNALGDASDAERAGAVTGEPHDSASPDTAWEVTTNLVSATSDPNADSLTGTAYGPVALVTAIAPQPEPSARPTSSSNDEEPTTALICLDPETGAVRWYRNISPIDNDHRDVWNTNSFISPYHPPLDMLVSSPDGEYVAFSLIPVPDGLDKNRILSDSNPRAWTNGFAVVSAKTGELVRVVQTKENILGQALTNDALVVQTSPTLHPSGGSISTYSLSNPDQAPATWDSTGWLAGATSRGVMQSPINLPDGCFDRPCSPETITISDPAAGTVTETYTGVRKVLPGGGLVRDIDSQGAPLASLSDDAAGSELVDLESGNTLNTSGHDVTRVVTATGAAWVLNVPRNVETGAPTRYLRWTPIGGSEGLHQEPLDVIEHESADARPTDLYLRRTTLTMEGTG